MEQKLSAHAVALEEVYNQLLQREQRYMTQLDTVVVHFKKPMLALNILPKEDVDMIFSNVEQLKFLSGTLFAELKSKGKDGIANAFMTVAPFFKLYAEYFTTYKTALNYVNTHQTEEPLKSFLKETMQHTNSEPLQNFLGLPVNVISRYITLLKEVSWLIPPSSVQEAELQAALTMLLDAQVRCQDVEKSKAYNDSMLAIQEVLGMPIIAPHRRLIRKGNLYRLNKKTNEWEEILAYLFNDIFCYGLRSKKDKKKDSQVFQLAMMEIGDVVASTDDSCFRGYVFKLAVAPGILYLKATSLTAKRSWMGDISSCIEAAKLSLSYAASLDCGPVEKFTPASIGFKTTIGSDSELFASDITCTTTTESEITSEDTKDRGNSLETPPRSPHSQASDLNPARDRGNSDARSRTITLSVDDEDDDPPPPPPPPSSQQKLPSTPSGKAPASPPISPSMQGKPVADNAKKVTGPEATRKKEEPQLQIATDRTNTNDATNSPYSPSVLKYLFSKPDSPPPPLPVVSPAAKTKSVPVTSSLPPPILIPEPPLTRSRSGESSGTILSGRNSLKRKSGGSSAPLRPAATRFRFQGGASPINLGPEVNPSRSARLSTVGISATNLANVKTSLKKKGVAK